MENTGVQNYTTTLGCQLKPKTQPHLHMCPSVCFYTLFFQPVGEVVFIQAAV